MKSLQGRNFAYLCYFQIFYFPILMSNNNELSADMLCYSYTFDMDLEHGKVTIQW